MYYDLYKEQCDRTVWQGVRWFNPISNLLSRIYQVYQLQKFSLISTCNKISTMKFYWNVTKKIDFFSSAPISRFLLRIFSFNLYINCQMFISHVKKSTNIFIHWCIQANVLYHTMLIPQLHWDLDLGFVVFC